MTRKTMFRTGLISAGALAGTLLAGGAAQAASTPDEHRNPGMQRMHELMQEQNPGMLRMHQLMKDGNPGMQRMMQGGGVHMGPATR
jgi:hypothetical protein